MIDQSDCPLRAVAAEPGVQVGTARAQLRGVEDLCVDPVTGEQRLQEARTLELIPRRIGGIDFQVFGERAHRLGRDRIPIEGLLRGGGGDRRHREGE